MEKPWWKTAQNVKNGEIAATRTVVFNLSWFVAPFQRLSTLVAPCSSIGCCNITAKLFSTDLCSWPPERTVSWLPRGTEGLS